MPHRLQSPKNTESQSRANLVRTQLGQYPLFGAKKTSGSRRCRRVGRSSVVEEELELEELELELEEGVSNSVWFRRRILNDASFLVLNYIIQFQVPARCAASEHCVCCGEVGACP
jgi:hypothetical protein